MRQQKNSILSIKKLEKKYSSGFELGPLDFDLGEGETLALLGPNGSGKSTLFQMLSGNSDPSGGQVFLSGKRLHPEAHALKRRIGYLPQNMELPKWVTGREVLNYAAGLYRLPKSEDRVNKLMKYWDCEAYQSKPLAACSHGMQKRIGLALSCIHKPKLLILDEPFSGLDLFHIKALKDEIRNRSEGGLATILSTHIAPYVAQLCSSALIIKNGRFRELDSWNVHSESERVLQVENEFF